MHVARPGPAVVLLLAFSSLPAAAAAERVVMPYVCTALGGGAVELDPSQPRSYDIVGAHEVDDFTHCSPDQPSRCKTWRVHRFDILCQGQRVPWYRVVAAASELNKGPAMTRGGRLGIRMRGPRSRSEPLPWGEPGGAPGRPESSAFGPGDVAVLPPGFAPVLAMEADFVRGTSGPAPSASASTPKSAAPAAAASPKATEKPAAAPTPAPPAPAKPAETATAPPQLVTPPAPASSSSSSSSGSTSSAPGPAHTAVAASAAEVKAGEEKSEAAKAAKPPPMSPPAAEKQPSPPATAEGVPPGSSSTSVVAASETAPSGTSPSSPVAVDLKETGSVVAPAGEAFGPTGSIGTAPPSSFAHLMAGLLAGLLLATASIAFVRRLRRASARAPALHDLGSVSLGDPGAATPPSASMSLVAIAPEPARDEPIVPPELPPLAPPPGTLSAALEQKAATNWLPATPADALQVLGTSPDASLEVIRKIVEGLRQSWHPDLARTEEDRLMREQRMKLINVAWDILQRQRRAA